MADIKGARLKALKEADIARNVAETLERAGETPEDARAMAEESLARMDDYKELREALDDGTILDGKMVRALLAERDALRADAERYRVIRNVRGPFEVTKHGAMFWNEGLDSMADEELTLAARKESTHGK